MRPDRILQGLNRGSLPDVVGDESQRPRCALRTAREVCLLYISTGAHASSPSVPAMPMAGVCLRHERRPRRHRHHRRPAARFVVGSRARSGRSLISGRVDRRLESRSTSCLKRNPWQPSLQEVPRVCSAPYDVAAGFTHRPAAAQGCAASHWLGLRSAKVVGHRNNSRRVIIFHRAFALSSVVTSALPAPGRRLTAGSASKRRQHLAPASPAGPTESTGLCNRRQLASMSSTPTRR